MVDLICRNEGYVAFGASGMGCHAQRGAKGPQACNAVIIPLRGVALPFRDDVQDYLSGVTAFRTAEPISFARSCMAASCFFTYSD